MKQPTAWNCHNECHRITIGLGKVKSKICFTNASFSFIYYSLLATDSDILCRGCSHFPPDVTYSLVYIIHICGILHSVWLCMCVYIYIYVCMCVHVRVYTCLLSVLGRVARRYPHLHPTVSSSSSLYVSNLPFLCAGCSLDGNIWKWNYALYNNTDFSRILST